MGSPVGKPPPTLRLNLPEAPSLQTILPPTNEPWGHHVPQVALLFVEAEIPAKSSQITKALPTNPMGTSLSQECPWRNFFRVVLYSIIQHILDFVQRLETRLYPSTQVYTCQWVSNGLG
ncbi:hypothetical protein MJO29_013171 [Puccinia striiformis f. sp. tritici]|uniref:Uncharacterized protein n=1 Tax=Puccinia striiformis TaxID=27350 RepID=A0A2S4UNA9_9BASI|nr:hypothetical protein MJO29_013171 [Puccinia striiformis f. sp. tritici]POV98750.1 hypothetical protein PSHT_13874 [Puccinia striiformis]